MIKRFAITIAPELTERQRAFLVASYLLNDATKYQLGEERIAAAFQRREEAAAELFSEGEQALPIEATAVELDPAKRYLILLTFAPEMSMNDRDEAFEALATIREELSARGIHDCAGAMPAGTKVEVTEAPWILALERRAARLGVAGQQVLADALRRVLKLGVSSEREARLVLTAQGVWSEDIDRILKNDLGICVACKTDRLVAVLTPDGKAWDAEGCPACHCTWCFQAPKTLAEIPAGARRMTWDEVKAKEIPDA